MTFVWLVLIHVTAAVEVVMSPLPGWSLFLMAGAAWWVILGLERLGLATEVQRPYILNAHLSGKVSGGDSYDTASSQRAA